MLLNFPAGLTEFTGPDGVKHKPDANGQVEVAAGDLGPFLAQGFMPAALASAEVDQEAALAALREAVTGTASGTNTGDETAARIGAIINGATAKTAPVDADMLGLMDSVSTPANVLKKLSWAYVKSVLKTYFDGLYTLAALDGVAHSLATAANDFLVASGAGVYIKKTLVETKVILGISVLDKALSGDLIFVITPGTVNRAATGEAWTRTVTINLKTAAGEIHTWFNRALTAGVSIADTSTAGTATIVSTTLIFVAGVASLVVSGDAAAWLAAETDTLTQENAVILGYTVLGAASVQTFT